MLRFERVEREEAALLRFAWRPWAVPYYVCLHKIGRRTVDPICVGLLNAIAWHAPKCAFSPVEDPG